MDKNIRLKFIGKGKKEDRSGNVFKNLSPFSFPLSPSLGFTLIELLVVIAVISVLATIAIGIINPIGQFQRAKDSQRKSDLAQIQRVLEQYYNDYGVYPASDGSYHMVDKSGTPHTWGTGWPPYTNDLPSDPSSSQRYVYYAAANGQTYYLYAHLERSDDSARCKSDGSDCTFIATIGSTLCSLSGNNLSCNYGVSSSNASP
jgi:type II secretion system protein G